MYAHDDNMPETLQPLACVSRLHGFALSESSSTEDADNSTKAQLFEETKEFESEIDPLGKRILQIATTLLETTDRITIKEILEPSELGEAAVRKRLNQLVHLKRLGCDPGTGRAPSQYYLLTDTAVETATDSNSLIPTDEELLEKIKQKEAKLRCRLESVQKDREALEHVIALKRNYIDE